MLWVDGGRQRAAVNKEETGLFFPGMLLFPEQVQ